MYILTNEAMPGLVKIGKTTRDPKTRAHEISRATGVPLPFQVNYYVYVNDCGWVELVAHRKLGSYRINSRREFFQISPRQAQEVVDRIAGPKIIPIGSAPVGRNKHKNRSCFSRIVRFLFTLFFMLIVCPFVLVLLFLLLENLARSL
ncbi:MAG: GIY-YIG nuclease family protein [Ardenticatenaceae bacterium]